MKQITNKEYENYIKVKKAERDGILLKPDALRMICEAYHNDPEKIGRHFLEVLAKMRVKHPEMFYVGDDLDCDLEQIED